MNQKFRETPKANREMLTQSRDFEMSEEDMNKFKAGYQSHSKTEELSSKGFMSLQTNSKGMKKPKNSVYATSSPPFQV